MVLIILLLSLVACGDPRAKDLEDLMRIRPEAKRIEEFRKKPIDEQIDLYLYAMRTEPPHLGFARYLALNGESMIPHVMSRMVADKDDWNKAHLIHLLRAMAEGNVPVRENAPLIIQVRAQISQMNGPAAMRAQEDLELIVRRAPSGKSQ